MMATETTPPTETTTPVFGADAPETATETRTERKKFHPISEIFPLMTNNELADLTLDIRKNGLREPISLHPDGRIIDGRNRYTACNRAGTKPDFRTWDGNGSLLTFVLSLTDLCIIQRD